MSDYYKILGINRNAKSSDIKKAYHKMARRYHPDKNRESGEDTTERFKQIKEAYETLSDGEKRGIYDKFGAEGLKRASTGRHPSGAPQHPFSMFGSMFRGGNPFGFHMNMNQRKRQKRGSNINHIHYYTLEELYMRVPMCFTYKREVICEGCKGLGVEDSSYIKTCDRCNGIGMINRVVQLGPGMIQQSSSPCNVCRGSGKRITPGRECKMCGGKKKKMGRGEIKIDCPNDLCNGSRANISGHGNEEPDGITGDLEVQFLEKAHPYITRCKNHLLYKHDITLIEALCGFNLDFKHLDGRVLNIVETGPLKPDSCYIIPGEGLNGGDLYIRYNITYPETLTDSQRSTLESIFPRENKNKSEGVTTETIRRDTLPSEVREQI